MNKITINAMLLKAAKHFQATNDIRYYLNGIHIKEDGTIEATNGHCGFHAQDSNIEGMDRDDIIIRYDGTIPARAAIAELIFMNVYGGIIQFKDSFEKPVLKSDVEQRISFGIIDGNFPDFNRVMPKGDPVPTGQIQLNTEYMALANKACKDLKMNQAGAVFTLYGKDDKITLKINNRTDPEITIIVMPMRM